MVYPPASVVPYISTSVPITTVRTSLPAQYPRGNHACADATGMRWWRQRMDGDDTAGDASMAYAYRYEPVLERVHVEHYHVVIYIIRWYACHHYYMTYERHHLMTHHCICVCCVVRWWRRLFGTNAHSAISQPFTTMIMEQSQFDSKSAPPSMHVHTHPLIHPYHLHPCMHSCIHVMLMHPLLLLNQ